MDEFDPMSYLLGLENGDGGISDLVTHETWTFTLEDDTEVEKEVVLWIGD